MSQGNEATLNSWGYYQTSSIGLFLMRESVFTENDKLNNNIQQYSHDVATHEVKINRLLHTINTSCIPPKASAVYCRQYNTSLP